MPRIGYARVSTGEQTAGPQREALVAAGCAAVYEETASGSDRERPVLARLLARISRGDTLEVIDRLEAKGAFFRSLADPIDTASPQGRFTPQVLGAAAEFERALIRERTRAGLASARGRGRVGGNPGLRQGGCGADAASVRRSRAAPATPRRAARPRIARRSPIGRSSSTGATTRGATASRTPATDY